MRNFRNLDVYKDSIDLCTRIYKLVEELPTSEKYGLRSQITRCSVSIPSNIAEGSSRRTSTDFARFLDISIGSAFELETQLTISSNIGLISSEKMESVLSDLSVLQKRLNALRTAILKK